MGDQNMMGTASTAATMNRSRRSRAMAAMDMPPWPACPPASCAPVVRAGAAVGADPSAVRTGPAGSGTHMCRGTDSPAQ